MLLAPKNEHDEDEDDEDDDMSTSGQSCTLCLVDFHRILRNLRSISKEENSAPLMVLLTTLAPCFILASGNDFKQQSLAGRLFSVAPPAVRAFIAITTVL